MTPALPYGVRLNEFTSDDSGNGGFSLYLSMLRAMSQSGSQRVSFISMLVCQGKLYTLRRR